MGGYGRGFSEVRAKGILPRLAQLAREPITKVDIIMWIVIVPAIAFVITLLVGFGAMS